MALMSTMESVLFGSLGCRQRVDRLTVSLLPKLLSLRNILQYPLQQDERHLSIRVTRVEINMSLQLFILAIVFFEI